MLPSFKLPFRFNPTRLKADLANIPPDAWIAHFNIHCYQGDWSGAALRSAGGVATQIYPDRMTAEESYANTALLDACPYFQEVLTNFKCPTEAVRLLKLTAGSQIREHRDYKLGYEDGEVRIHIPVVTCPEVEFFLAGETLEMNEGEAWYINVNLPHRVENRSSIDRVHLVIDCVVNDWLRFQLGQD